MYSSIAKGTRVAQQRKIRVQNKSKDKQQVSFSQVRVYVYTSRGRLQSTVDSYLFKRNAFFNPYVQQIK